MHRRLLCLQNLFSNGVWQLQFILVYTIFDVWESHRKFTNKNCKISNKDFLTDRPQTFSQNEYTDKDAEKDSEEVQKAIKGKQAKSILKNFITVQSIIHMFLTV